MISRILQTLFANGMFYSMGSYALNMARDPISAAMGTASVWQGMLVATAAAYLYSMKVIWFR